MLTVRSADTFAKTGAPKNKQCPFCNDYFTSSSLGRHLDLYIKEKSPKTADGVHDVDKIKQLRSNITRRQPRRNPQKPSQGATPASDAAYQASITTSPYELVAGTEEHGSYHVNKPTWEATGVMTGVNSPGFRLGLATRKQVSRSEAIARKKILDDRTRLRAAELALQELLDSVNAARYFN